jgi:DMSO/TMAO reductase YedYZ molybdopterin-dependent catalytic subunit
MRLFLTLPFALLLSTSGLAAVMPATPAHHAHAAAPVPAGPLVVAVFNTPTMVLDTATRATLPRTTVSAGAHGAAPVAWSGVALVEVLRRAGAPLDKALDGKALGSVVRVIGSDGYVAVFALAELGAGFGKARVLLADARDGKPLGDDGPLRLVVPGDARSGRWVRRVERIEVVDASGR